MAEDLKIVKTDVLKVEVFDMPIIDLSIRFAWRIVEPVPLMWQTDGRISVTMNSSIDRDKVMRNFFMNKWKLLIFESKNQEADLTNWNEHCKWLEEVGNVNIVYCDLVPRSN